ncbi:MAG: hypothetical protein KatS3mg008_1000 [Acidimicrobiales bacterium]|nr:MAG: hypothetical protein KatS3mg008_1000 [Acidimicrobiales bacterium]
MGGYLIVESREPFGSRDVERMWDLAEQLAKAGDEVTVFLVQNGVLPVRTTSAAASRLAGLAGRVRVLADEFSLRERAIRSEELVAGVRVSNVDELVDLMLAEGTKVIWH